MNAAQARALLFARKLTSKNIEIPVEGLEDLTGQLSVLELTGADTSEANKLATGQDGNIDPLLSTSAMICRVLVLRETKERVFSDTDYEAVSRMGMPILKTLEEEIGALSNVTPKAVNTAKKNSQTPPENTSNASSVETSAAAPTESGVSA